MTIKIQAAQRLAAAPRSSPSSMSNADLKQRMIDSVSRMMEHSMKDLGMSYENALSKAKYTSTAGPAVWAEIEKKYKHLKASVLRKVSLKYKNYTLTVDPNEIRVTDAKGNTVSATVLPGVKDANAFSRKVFDAFDTTGSKASDVLNMILKLTKTQAKDWFET